MSEQFYKAFWDEALNQLHEEYRNNNKEDEFQIWFKMEYAEESLNEIKVSVPSDFMWTQMVRLGYKDQVQEKISELTGQNITISYVVKPKAPSQSKPVYTEETVSQEIKNTSNETETKQSSSYKEEAKTESTEAFVQKTTKTHPQLRSDYTFESFVPGDHTIFAYNASMAAAQNPGKAYNPILIYGGVGLGKTHLMQSIGNYIYNESGDSKKICYVSAENFTNEFVTSVREKSADKFKAKYRKLDVLLLDDIHFLQEKEATQEELFHTFEALYQNKAQMVFTCDRPITELKGIEERLKTRFSRGMSIDLQPPDYETRRAILQKKLILMGKTMPPEVLDFIAKNVQTNVRDLESCLNKMIAYAELMNKTLTLEIAQNQLRDTFSQPASGTITIDTIQKVVADHYNISLSDIKSKHKSKKIVVPRQIAIYIARNLTEYSFPELGNEFGGRDHTTIMHSYEKIEEQLKVDSSLDTTIQMLIREIKDYRK